MVTRSTRKVIVSSPCGIWGLRRATMSSKKTGHSRSAPSERPIVRGISAMLRA